MLFVFDERVDTGIEQAVSHINQFLEFRLGIIDNDTHVRAVPDQSPTILNHIIRITCTDVDIGILGYLLIHQLVTHGIHQGIEVVRTNHQPTFLRPLHRIQVVVRHFGVLSIPRGVFLCFGVQHLQTSTEGTKPYSAPLILCQCPDTVVGQSTRTCLYIDDLSLCGVRGRRDGMRQSTIVGTEPYSAVAGSPRTYDNIAHQATIVLGKMIHDLTGLGIIQQDTLIVGTNPVIAALILTSSRDITQFDTHQTGMRSDILVDTVLIGTDPYTAIIGLTDRTKSVIADRGFVVFVIQELFPLIVFHIDDNKTVVVAHQPQPVILINNQVPHHQWAGNAANSL